jgi:hypothetical protein
MGLHNLATAQVYTASMTATPNHRTCYSGSLTVNYTAAVVPPRGYTYGVDYTFNSSQTTFKLRTTASGVAGTVLLTNTGGTMVNSTISGSFDLSAASLAPDVYTIYASITVVTGGTSQIIQTTTTFVIGYQANWASLLDMQALPSIYSAKRSAVTGGITTARAISSNKLASSTDGWMDLGAQFGGTSGAVTFVIGKTTTSITNPATQTYRITFNRSGSTTGSVVVSTPSLSYVLSGMSFDNRILIRRLGSQMRFYNSATGTLISGSPIISYTGELNVGAFADNLNDGASNIVTSFNCVFENQFFYLKNEVEQSIAYIPSNDNKLRFKYEEAYFDVSGTLNYSIKCLNDDVTPTTVTVSKPTHTNWIEIPLGTGGVAFTAGNIYLLEVTDVKGRKQYLKYRKM